MITNTLPSPGVILLVNKAIHKNIFVYAHGWRSLIALSPTLQKRKLILDTVDEVSNSNLAMPEVKGNWRGDQCEKRNIPT